MRDRSYLWIGT